MVVVKPISRWQVWLGKWFGILAVNAILLLLSASAVFLLLQWRSQKLPPQEQAILHNEILVARGSIKPRIPAYDPAVQTLLEQWMKKNPAQATDPAAVASRRKQILEGLKASNQITPPGFYRTWKLDPGLAKDSIRGHSISLRIKFNTPDSMLNSGKTYQGYWVVGDFASSKAYHSEPMNLAADSFHEFTVPAGSELLDSTGKLQVNFLNASDSVLLFPEDEGIEVLYREGGFALNYFRAVGIIWFWMAFLAAVGLMASSFLSFPVAAFFSIGVLIVGMSTGTISLILEQGTVFEVNHDTGKADAPTLVDYVALPVFRALLKTINLVRGFSPIDSLSTGRSVSWSEFSLAFGQIFVLLSGILAAIGITVFTRRELATAQSTQ
jgi:ABC-type transport system involved in multi-copper enzyme maturation permease subunit